MRGAGLFYRKIPLKMRVTVVQVKLPLPTAVSRASPRARGLQEGGCGADTGYFCSVCGCATHTGCACMDDNIIVYLQVLPPGLAG